MNEDQITSLVNRLIQQAQTNGAFGGSPIVPYHVHNGVDSPTIPFVQVTVGTQFTNTSGTKIPTNIRSSSLMLAGVVTLVSGRYVIKDSRITQNSIIIVTPQDTAPEGATAYNFAAGCVDGSATIAEGSGTSIDQVNYLIII